MGSQVTLANAAKLAYYIGLHRVENHRAQTAFLVTMTSLLRSRLWTASPMLRLRPAVPVNGSTYATTARLLSRAPSQPSSTKSRAPPSGGVGSITIKAGVLFAGLSAFAIALTVYGVWDYFAAFRVWPKELREPLRAAVKAQRNGKWKRSEKNFRHALETARMLGAEKLGKDPLLKTTGIAIALSAVLEEQGAWQEAIQVYLDALEEVRQTQQGASEPKRTPQEWMRAVALAQKIGDIAQKPGVHAPSMAHGPKTITEEPCESYLAWSVEEMMRLVRGPSKEPVHLEDLPLPPWVDRQDLGASVEALGAFYASRGMAEYAVPLYVQAISMLLPTRRNRDAANDSPPPTVAERCYAAILMNNISQALTQFHTDPGTMQRAIAWAMKGLDLVSLTSFRAGFLSDMPSEERDWLLQFSGLDPQRIGGVAKTVEAESDVRLAHVKQQCLGTQFVLLYNLGMFYSMQNDKATARTLFRRAMRQADRMQLRDARSQCARAIARLDRDGDAQT